MYVCLCKGITDTQIKEAIENGACSLEDLSDSLGVAQGCGGCAGFAENILRRQLDDPIDSRLYYQVA